MKSPNTTPRLLPEKLSEEWLPSVEHEGGWLPTMHVRADLPQTHEEELSRTYEATDSLVRLYESTDDHGIKNIISLFLENNTNSLRHGDTVAATALAEFLESTPNKVNPHNAWVTLRAGSEGIAEKYAGMDEVLGLLGYKKTQKKRLDTGVAYVADSETFPSKQVEIHETYDDFTTRYYIYNS